MSDDGLEREKLPTWWSIAGAAVIIFAACVGAAAALTLTPLQPTVAELYSSPAAESEVYVNEYKFDDLDSTGATLWLNVSTRDGQQHTVEIIVRAMDSSGTVIDEQVKSYSLPESNIQQTRWDLKGDFTDYNHTEIVIEQLPA